MKKFILFIFFVSASCYINAQNKWDYNWDIKAHDIGQLHLHLGFGAPRVQNKLFDKYSSFPNYSLIGAGPLTAKLEYGFNRKLSVQAGVTFIKFKATWDTSVFNSGIGINQNVDQGINVNNFSFIARLNYHLFVTPHSDLYLGGGIGYDMYKAKDYTQYDAAPLFKSYFNDQTGISFEGGLGYKFFFLTRTAFYIEAGYGKSYVQAGVVIKLIQPKENRIF